jgi:hypothetical protein
MDLDWLREMIEKAHSVQVAECSTLPLNKVQLHAAGIEIQLICERQDSNGSINHQLAAVRKTNGDLGRGVRMASLTNGCLEP